jgi:hypothetical protein
MQGMVSGVIVVAAFAIVACAAGFVAVRLYRVTSRARPAEPDGAEADGASAVSSVSEAPDA